MFYFFLTLCFIVTKFCVLAWFLKQNKVLLFFNSSSSSSSITYILRNNSNIAYFWHNVFNKLNQTFILTDCREYL